MNADSRVAIVTGGARGIGYATCRKLVSDGVVVAVTDIDLDAAKAACAELDPDGARVAAAHVDVADTASVETMVAEVTQRFGRLDILVNIAGITGQAAAHEMTDDDWHRLVEIHLGGTFRCCRAAYPALAASGSGAVVNMASIAARVGLPKRLSYAASKAGIEGITRTLAVEWADDRIRVNAVAPGWTRTRLVQDSIDRGLIDEARMAELVPLGRLGRPEEIANCIAFLASDAASYVTGQTLVIDGGITITIKL